MPPMGLDVVAALGCAFDAADVRALLDAVAARLRAPYDTLLLSDCVFPRGARDPATGELRPDAARFAPDGVAGLAAYAHSRGLRLGIGTDAGSATCAGFEGSFGREALDAQTFALWGVDAVVASACSVSSAAAAAERLAAVGAAVGAAARPMAFFVAAPGLSAWRFARDFAHAWAVGASAPPALPAGGQTWRDVLRNADDDAPHAAVAGPGGWNDPGPLGVGHPRLSDDEQTCQVSLWAALAAPLMVACDVRNASERVLALAANPEVASIDQDQRGSQGMLVWSDGIHQIWAKRLYVASPGDRAVAIVLVNRAEQAATVVASWDEVGLQPGLPASVRDLWARKDLGIHSGSFSTLLRPHACAFYRLSQKQS